MLTGFGRALAGAALLATTAALGAQAPTRPPAPAPAQTGPAKAAAQSAAAQAALIAHLDAVGFAQLDRRATAIAGITSRADAERRQADVRRTIESLVGGVPKASGRVAATSFGTVADDGFTIENVAFESVPGYWVTANVFVPAGQVRSPRWSSRRAMARARRASTRGPRTSRAPAS